MLSHFTHYVSKHISKNTKFNFICQYRNTPHTIITHSCEKKDCFYLLKANTLRARQ